MGISAKCICSVAGYFWGVPGLKWNQYDLIVTILLRISAWFNCLRAFKKLISVDQNVENFSPLLKILFTITGSYGVFWERRPIKLFHRPLPNSAFPITHSLLSLKLENNQSPFWKPSVASIFLSSSRTSRRLHLRPSCLQNQSQSSSEPYRRIGRRGSITACSWYRTDYQ